MKLAPPATVTVTRKAAPVSGRTVPVSALYKFKLGQRYRVSRQPGGHSSPVHSGTGSSAWVAEFMFGRGVGLKSGFEKNVPRGPTTRT